MRLRFAITASDELSTKVVARGTNRGWPDHVDSIAVTPSDLRLADGGTYQILLSATFP
jgi:hypothetical protein